MGHLVNANSMRIGWAQDWCDIWFGKKLIYNEFLYSCLRIRYFLIYLFFGSNIKNAILIIYSHFIIYLWNKEISIYVFYYHSRFEIRYHEGVKKFWRVINRRRRINRYVGYYLKNVLKKNLFFNTVREYKKIIYRKKI